MKAVVKLLSFCLILISTIGLSRCGNEEVQGTKVSVEPCKDTAKEFTPTHFFNNIEGTVIERKMTFTPDVFYYIEAPAAYKKTIQLPLYPCNMPEDAKQDGLKVRFSGHLLTFPGEEMLNREARDFELSSMKLLITD